MLSLLSIMFMWRWLWNHSSKWTCPAKITLWASTCWPSSQARVTSAKLLSSFKFPKAQLCHSYWPTFSSEKYEKPLHNTTFHKEGAERTRLQSLRQRAGRSLRTERSWRTMRAQRAGRAKRAQRALSTECLCPQMLTCFLEILRLVHSFILLFKGFCFSRSLSAVSFLALAVCLNLINQTLLTGKTNLHFFQRVRTKIRILLRPKTTTNQTSWRVLRINLMSRSSVHWET